MTVSRPGESLAGASTGRRIGQVAAVAALLLVAVTFLRVSPRNPPGFFRDESAIAYNAYTLATTGKDEYGARTPLFIRSFDDYKSPLYVYLLAGVYRVTGLSTAVARDLSAVLGLAAVLVLYLLALAIARRQWAAVAVALLAGLTPWLFETSRLVFEVALMPLVLALLLLTVYRASSGVWSRWHSVAIGLLLGALAYSYQAGRILAPLLAVGLLLCWYRGPRRRLALVWAVFLASVAPIAVWSHAHPGAVTARYRATTYIHDGMSPGRIVEQFLAHYASNVNVWRWLVRGDPSEVQHVKGAGTVFFVEIALAIAGVVVVLLRRRDSPWWRFVLVGVLASPVAASLTDGTFPSLRMAALAVYLPLLALPALEAIGSVPRATGVAVLATLLAVFVAEAVHWQVVYARNGPDRSVAFEAGARPLVDDALRRAGTVYAFRSAHGPYVDTLLYGTIAGRPSRSLVVLDPRARPPVGALVVGIDGECPQCPRVGQAGYFETFRYRPARPGVLRTHFQLNSPLLPVGSPYQFLVELDNTGAEAADHVTLVVKLPSGMRLSGPPYHERGTGCVGTQTLICDVGYLPGRTSTLFRYEVVLASPGPQTMTAGATSADLNVNPAGTGSAFTVDASPSGWARQMPVRPRALCREPVVICPL